MEAAAGSSVPVGVGQSGKGVQQGALSSIVGTSSCGLWSDSCVSRAFLATQR